MGKVVIKPRPGSGKFRGFAQMLSKTVERTDDQGRKYTESGGEYKSERLPRTKGWRRPQYNNDKRRFYLEDEHGKEYSEEWLDRVVSQSKLRYAENHKLDGDIITKADPSDPFDEFFNHPSMKVFEDEGVIVLDEDDPIHKILLGWIRGNKREFAPSSQKVFSPSVKYVIVDAQGDERSFNVKLNKKAKAYEILQKMDLRRKKDVVSVMINKDYLVEPSEDILNTEIYKFIEDESRVFKTGRQLIDEFIHIAQMPLEELEVRMLVQKGIRTNTITLRSGKFMFDGKHVGNSIDDLVYHFFKADNASDFEKLEKRTQS
jgi:hypothetical protein